VEDVVKRTLDVVASASALFVLSPVLAGTACVVRLSLGSPVLFRQQRPGRHGIPFELIKFRTMRQPRPGEDLVSTDAVRLTRVGSFLRERSLDELPTLWNVLKGDMSLVGPRPLLVQYLERYTPEQARRHEVKPGITGWAQINGRNLLDWEKKFELDVWYVDHQSLWLDLFILARTVRQVLQREGISYGGYATMQEFLGSSAGGTAGTRFRGGGSAA
jgi:sugar transferase EpsL